MKESVTKFIVYNKFVTGPTSTQQSFLWKRAMHCEQRLSRPNRTITLLALLQLCLKVYLRKGCSFSTHPCHPCRKFFVWPVIRLVSVFLNVDYLHATPFAMTSSHITEIAELCRTHVNFD